MDFETIDIYDENKDLARFLHFARWRENRQQQREVAYFAVTSGYSSSEIDAGYYVSVFLSRMN